MIDINGIILSEENISMHVSLTPELDQYVHGKVESGRYNSASEVVREALRIMQERDEVRSIQLAEMRIKIQEGVLALKAGDYVEGTSRQLLEAAIGRSRQRIASSPQAADA